MASYRMFTRGFYSDPALLSPNTADFWLGAAIFHDLLQHVTRSFCDVV